MTRRYRARRPSPIWQCPTCGFGVGAQNWARHRRWCTGARLCPACMGDFPCRTAKCAGHERTHVVLPDVPPPGKAPTKRMVRSLSMHVRREVNAKGEECWIARWKGQPREDEVSRPTWREVYDELVKQRSGDGVAR